MAGRGCKRTELSRVQQRVVQDVRPRGAQQRNAPLKSEISNQTTSSPQGCRCNLRNSLLRTGCILLHVANSLICGKHIVSPLKHYSDARNTQCHYTVQSCPTPSRPFSQQEEWRTNYTSITIIVQSSYPVHASLDHTFTRPFIAHCRFSHRPNGTPLHLRPWLSPYPGTFSTRFIYPPPEARWRRPLIRHDGPYRVSRFWLL